jgi:hypothetical protein
MALMNSAVKVEQQPRSHYIPGGLMAASVLYAKSHPENHRAGDPAVLALALKFGDVLAGECEAGVYTRRPDHHRDTSRNWDPLAWRGGAARSYN